MEQIAHVASHDLQEPLRKIRTFSSRLLLKHAAHLGEEVKSILNRIDTSATRMHELIYDVIAFTNLIHSTENTSMVELNVVIQKVLEELKHEIKSKNARVEYEPLPTVQGYPKQLFLLFKSLLDNSLKFTREGVLPEIFIKFRKKNIKDNLYYHLTVEDNGIGFDNEFGKKIFILFQRLHTQQSNYQGKGMGLAIVQRVMVNHNGIVGAKGTPGKGAIFNLYFPALT